jgi:hypothetical protein
MAKLSARGDAKVAEVYAVDHRGVKTTYVFTKQGRMLKKTNFPAGIVGDRAFGTGYTLVGKLPKSITIAEAVASYVKVGWTRV